MLTFGPLAALPLASGPLALTATLSLAATEAPDMVALGAAGYTGLALTLTEAPDVVSAASAVAWRVTLGVTEASDVASFLVGNGISLTLATSEAADIAGLDVLARRDLQLDVETGFYVFDGQGASINRRVYITPVTGSYLLNGYTIRVFKSSFVYTDTEIIYVPSEVNSASVPAEYRVVALSKDYNLEELFEDRGAEAGPRLRVWN